MKYNVNNRKYKEFYIPQKDQSYNRGWDDILPIRNESASSYYLDTGSYTLHNFKDQEYEKNFSIPKGDLLKIIDQSENYDLLLRTHYCIEGGISAVYALEYYVHKIIHANNFE